MPLFKRSGPPLTVSSPTTGRFSGGSLIFDSIIDIRPPGAVPFPEEYGNYQIMVAEQLEEIKRRTSGRLLLQALASTGKITYVSYGGTAFHNHDYDHIGLNPHRIVPVF
jgi:hypothetical protein